MIYDNKGLTTKLTKNIENWTVSSSIIDKEADIRLPTAKTWEKLKVSNVECVKGHQDAKKEKLMWEEKLNIEADKLAT